ncbi:hypothetical protein DERP_006772 [Dermatophagoides pteronyssinus]|uniref:Uncharacterized protein n=1 Tax=Dermatophagoides pteronyssinus TaxID=6956 RepID=A0ABQ8IRY5_DERPT|nr:hypothetical protein DERP_006772 [Dermatophagoides pteronyssinus]
MEIFFRYFPEFHPNFNTRRPPGFCPISMNKKHLYSQKTKERCEKNWKPSVENVNNETLVNNLKMFRNCLKNNNRIINKNSVYLDHLIDSMFILTFLLVYIGFKISQKIFKEYLYTESYKSSQGTRRKFDPQKKTNSSVSSCHQNDG